MVAEELSLVRAHLTEGRAGAALVAALAAWRKLHAPELADLVDAIGRQVDRSMTPLTGTRDAEHARWVELAGLRRPADLGRLLVALPNTSIAKARRRYALLAGFEPDPRMVEPVLAIPMRYSSYDAVPLYNAALGIAARTNDARARPIFAHLIARLERDLMWRGRLVKTRATRDGLVDVALPPELGAVVAACISLCEQLLVSDRVPSEAELLAETAGPDRSLADLLAAVHADPDDDTARAVYADALLETGDPRGELITLQLQRARDGTLSRAADERERALLRKHGRNWLGVLDTVITEMTFARGFLDTCHVKAGKPARQLRGNPMWSTVRELHCTDMAIVTDPAFRTLRRATITPAALAELARRPAPVPLEAALDATFDSWQPEAHEPEEWGAALGVGALVHLRSVQVVATHGTPDALAWLLDSALGRQLAMLELVHANATGNVSFAIPLAPWLEIAARGPGVRLGFKSWSGPVTVEAAAGRVVLEVPYFTWQDAGEGRTIPGKLREVFAGFPDPRAPALELRCNVNLVGPLRALLADYFATVS